MNIRKYLDKAVQSAMQKAGAPSETHAMVRPSAKKEFGDYQANGMMGAAKSLKMNPRDFALKVVEELGAPAFAEKLEVAGPGFINIFLRPEWIASQAAAALLDERLGVEKSAQPGTIVIDYSSPNLAKEMHVGHLRSTIIGDALARVFTFTGNTVCRQNHLGDWGTGFGMLIAYLERRKSEGLQDPRLELANLEEFYIAAKKLFDSDPSFADESRRYVVAFQSGDEDKLKLWRDFVTLSLEHAEIIYERLGILLTREDVRSESAYNSELAGIVQDLRAKGLLVEDQGAQCVFLEEFKNKDGTHQPIIVQKSGGGYLYSTTDLATIRYRSHVLNGTRLLYVVDSRQGHHFHQIFTLARKAGYLPERTSAEHVGFGVMLDKSGKPFKTRTGGNIKLSELLDESERRAFALVQEKNADLPEDEKKNIARVVGMSSVKYADLSKHRMSDYIFDFDNMLSFEGNTAPYMLYAYARIASILRRAGLNESEVSGTIALNSPEERTLALKLLQFDETLQAVAAEALPHYLCSYLFELAGTFMSFYEACPVLNASEPSRTERLRLAALTSRTLKTGLGLLGIETLDRM